MPKAPLIEFADEFFAQAAARDARALNALIRHYSQSLSRLEIMLESLLAQIGDSRPTVSQLRQVARYRQLIAYVSTELVGLQAQTANAIQEEIIRNARLGAAHARQLISAAATGSPALAGSFASLPGDAVQAIVAFFAPGSPLYERLQLLAPTAADWVARMIKLGITQGHNPRRIAAAVQSAFGRGLTDALRFVRTAQLYAYRMANHATYAANSDVVEGWIWYAHLGPRTCASCLAMHGTFHPLHERLSDHHNGRCAPVPQVRGYDNPVTMTGEDWLAQQPRQTQLEVLGRGKWELWQQGELDFKSLTTVENDDVYGPMRVETPLQRLINSTQPAAARR